MAEKNTDNYGGSRFELPSLRAAVVAGILLYPVVVVSLGAATETGRRMLSEADAHLPLLDPGDREALLATSAGVEDLFASALFFAPPDDVRSRVRAVILSAGVKWFTLRGALVPLGVLAVATFVGALGDGLAAREAQRYYLAESNLSSLRSHLLKLSFALVVPTAVTLVMLLPLAWSHGVAIGSVGVFSLCLRAYVGNLPYKL